MFGCFWIHDKWNPLVFTNFDILQAPHFLGVSANCFLAHAPLLCKGGQIKSSGIGKPLDELGRALNRASGQNPHIPKREPANFDGLMLRLWGSTPISDRLNFCRPCPANAFCDGKVGLGWIALYCALDAFVY